MTQYTVTGTKDDLMKSEKTISYMLFECSGAFGIISDDERYELTNILHAIGKAINEPLPFPESDTTEQLIAEAQKTIGKLPDSWCVLNDGSQRFKDVVIGEIEAQTGMGWFAGTCVGEYYGLENGNQVLGLKPFAPVLTIDEFERLTTKQQ